MRVLQWQAVIVVQQLQIPKLPQSCPGNPEAFHVGLVCVTPLSCTGKYRLPFAITPLPDAVVPALEPTSSVQATATVCLCMSAVTHTHALTKFCPPAEAVTKVWPRKGLGAVSES